MHSLKKQQGLGLILWLCTIFIIACIVSLVVKLVPVYMENYMVRKIVESVQDEAVKLKSDSSGDASHDVREFIMRRLEINNIQRIAATNLTISSANGGLDVRVAYEVRIPVVANIDAMLHFDNFTRISLQ